MNHPVSTTGMRYACACMWTISHACSEVFRSWRRRRETTRDDLSGPCTSYKSYAVQSIGRSRERMRFILPLVILLGACTCHARDDEIEINEIDNGESVPRETQRVRNITLAQIFENAIQAYLEEDWDGCIAGFNDALHGYVIIIPSASSILSSL